MLLCLLVGVLHVMHVHPSGQDSCDLCLAASAAFTVPAASWIDLLPRRSPSGAAAAPGRFAVQAVPCASRAPPALFLFV